MTGDMVFQLILFLLLLAILFIFTAAVKFLFRKNSMKPNLEVEQKLDQIIELLQSEANKKR
ncbi:DUF4083 family protein [Cytobacillus kochii]|uniref:DUF4083 domain-containing protein n=2 Tax=Cytobacillus TaxID=2675230 RepID=A0A248TN34_9BACI|nr:hypothetical protein CKF48_21230 [Cytobacillus kochii]